MERIRGQGLWGIMLLTLTALLGPGGAAREEAGGGPVAAVLAPRAGVVESSQLARMAAPSERSTPAQVPDRPAGPGSGGGGEAARARLQAAYGRLPLYFEANRGQTAREVSFLARGLGYGLFLTPTEAVLAVGQPSAAMPQHSGEVPESAEGKGAVLRLQLVGAASDTQPTGEQALAGTSNFFLGNDPTQWRTHVPTYAKVRYRNVYPGIDLVFYGTQRQLEHDFIVAPGAEPTSIRLAVTGAAQLALTPEGSLRLHLPGGEVQLQRPQIYQEVAGRRRPIAGGYVLLPVPDTPGATSQVGFTVAAYDPEIPLVIDPVLEYSTYLGGSYSNSAGGLAVDSAGNIYVSGGTSSPDFPITAGAAQATLGGQRDAFIAKLNPTGTALVYATYLGGAATTARISSP